MIAGRLIWISLHFALGPLVAGRWVAKRQGQELEGKRRAAGGKHLADHHFLLSANFRFFRRTLSLSLSLRIVHHFGCWQISDPGNWPLEVSKRAEKESGISESQSDVNGATRFAPRLAPMQRNNKQNTMPLVLATLRSRRVPVLKDK